MDELLRPVLPQGGEEQGSSQDRSPPFLGAFCLHGFGLPLSRRHQVVVAAQLEACDAVWHRHDGKGSRRVCAGMRSMGPEPVAPAHSELCVSSSGAGGADEQGRYVSPAALTLPCSPSPKPRTCPWQAQVHPSLCPWCLSASLRFRNTSAHCCLGHFHVGASCGSKLQKQRLFGEFWRTFSHLPKHCFHLPRGCSPVLGTTALSSPFCTVH